ncbi:MAG: Phospho-2-dehydro-3-deoxyheptonate aldolase, Tyr-sensitive [Chlamydiales bacterium]|nr:Phospho-2-dehydro-3-deoxyheptonate aldolase, Tyr-sensitive [Chlamydiales bacterium]MCH9619156.1 Phospho-2-dehydro-3-deoxyheptonate aldolase, Tyr-sensitive [Chlamydiales bacterium]MCH9622418.1 Phospho-2-dehydro-3-deoxyheptonate aldolase, Tyr-sensitive [Chlamydiales bacterium]
MTLITIEQEELSAVITPPDQLQKEIPLTTDQLKFILQSRKEIEQILRGDDPRLLLLIGPCSIHEVEAAKEYGMRLKELAAAVCDRFFLVMRTYFEKPRTTIGWKGMLYDPHLDGSHEMEDGIRLSRKLLSDLTDLQIPLGSEILEMSTSHYYADYLSWGCIGARTSASPPHRQLASYLDMPIGFKNTPDGNTEVPVQAIIASSTSHIFLGTGANGQLQRLYTPGNPNGHLILRGSEDRPNYFPQDIKQVALQCQEGEVNDRLLIDCSHDNSCKIAKNQRMVFEAVVEQVALGNRHIAGAMLESHLNEGSQEPGSKLKYGVSITDPCLGWEATERLIFSAYHRLEGTPLLHLNKTI